MRSKTSLFNPTLFRKNLTRFWPIWGVYALIWILLLPANVFITHMNALRHGMSQLDLLHRIADRYVLTYTAEVGVLLAFAFGLLAAMAVFSYLYNARSAGLMHTLPIRREGLFLTNWLSGYCFLLFPHLLLALLLVLTESAAGVLNGWNIFMWLLIQGGTCFFFYTFAVFCAMFTGHLVALPAFYGILNFLVLIVTTLLEALISLFTYGYRTGGALSHMSLWFTPIAKLMEELYFRTVVENGVEVELFTGFQFVLLYMAVALVMLVCALLLYRVRHMETAGDVIAVSWAKPIFKYGFAFCAALCGGMFLYYTFSPLFSSTVLPLTVFMVLCGALGCFIAEMFLQKSFKVFRRGWKACGVFCLAVILLMAGLSRDFFGVETWVPDPADVESVTVNTSSFPPYDSAYGYDRLTDPAFIEKAVAIHQAIVDDRDFLQNASEYGVDASLANSYDYLHFSVDYTLRNGGSASRYYSLMVRTDDPEDRLASLFLDYLNDPARLMGAYFPYEDKNAAPVQGELAYYDAGTGLTQTAVITSDVLPTLVEAIREDVAAGRLGIHYLSDNDPERMDNCSVTDLTITWLYTGDNGKTFTRDTTVTPQFSATSLMDTLHELGILDENKVLLSHTGLAALTSTDDGRMPDTTGSAVPEAVEVFPPAEAAIATEIPYQYASTTVVTETD